MTNEEFLNLQEGDIVQHIDSGFSYIIIYSLYDFHNRTSYIGVRVQRISNANEWKLIKKEAKNV